MTLLYKEVSRVLGRFFLCLTAIFLIPLALALFYEKASLEKGGMFQTSATLAFMKTMALSLLLAALFSWLGRGARRGIYRKESILLVALIWLLTPAMGALPFLFTKTIPQPLDAYFEAMSGLTTTGATIIYPKAYLEGKEVPITLNNPLDPSIIYTFYGTVPPLCDPETGTILKEGVEALGPALLFWRSFLQWIGGMGIVVLFIAVLPALSLGGKFLYETEVSGPTKEGIAPRMQETAMLLWKIYLGLTLFQTALLLLSHSSISLFEAINLSFSTISTGGFTIRNDGLLSHGNGYTQTVLAIFMILGSLNFTLYFHLLKKNFSWLWNREFLFYLVILAAGCCLMTAGLVHIPKFSAEAKPDYFSFGEALGTGCFQAISTQTSTGFFLTNYDFWPFSCQFLMVLLMFIGGMSGSTTGGVKVVRFILIFKMIRNRIEALFRPEQVRVLKIGDKEIPDKKASAVLIFFVVMSVLAMVGGYLLMLDQNDVQTALGIISGMMNNTGLGFGGIGSYGSFAFLSPFSKTISIIWMLLGRLEYFALLVLLVPAFWRR